jgi:hypothetical protein
LQTAHTTATTAANAADAKASVAETDFGGD